MNHHGLTIVLLASTLCGACSSDETEPGSTSIGGVRLNVDSAKQLLLLDGRPPAAGTTYMKLDITLENFGSPTAVPTGFQLFSIQTDKALVVAASLKSVMLADACDLGTSIAKGGVLRCGLLFELARGQSPAIAIYDDVQGHASTIAVPAVVDPSTCERSQRLDRADGSCFSCYVSNCMTERSAVATACESDQCDYCYEGDDECTCLQGCESSTCWSAYEAEMACTVSKCADSCGL